MRGFVGSLASSLRRLRLRQDGGATHIQTPGKQLLPPPPPLLLLLLKQYSGTSPLVVNILISALSRVRETKQEVDYSFRPPVTGRRLLECVIPCSQISV
ncbi:hypothetical protein PAMA_013087 [Pampus argenteus]